MGCSGAGASLFFVSVAAGGDFGRDGNESGGKKRGESCKGRGEGQGIFCGEEQSRSQEDGGDEDALAALLCGGADTEGDGSAETGDVAVPEVLHDLPGDLRKIVETEKGCGEEDDRDCCAHFFSLCFCRLPGGGFMTGSCFFFAVFIDLLRSGAGFCRKACFFLRKTFSYRRICVILKFAKIGTLCAP